MNNDYPNSPAPAPETPPAPAQPAENPAPPAYAAYPARPLPPAPHQRPRRPSRAVEISLISISLVIVVLLLVAIFSVFAVGGSLGAAFTPSLAGNNPPANSFSVLRVEGSISSSGTSYNHAATLEHIKQLSENDNNKGILLYLDTPGGGVYESDELYRALLGYKEQTGRPVYAYMAATCASGGYYVSMAADHIVANYNTVTGSIGVYIALTDTSGLYEKLGIKTVLVRSGENKAVGTQGVEITPAQQAVYQSSVDESYERFVGLVAAGRGMDSARARELADGRIYTASQALENGLVDELGDWDAALEIFAELTGAEAFHTDFSNASAIGDLFTEAAKALPRGEAEAALQAADELSSGVLMAYAAELAG